MRKLCLRVSIPKNSPFLSPRKLSESECWMCNQAFYALKRCWKGGKFLRKLFRWVTWLSRKLFMFHFWLETKKGGLEQALHKSYKHCRYDLINITNNVAPCSREQHREFPFHLRQCFSLSSEKTKSFYCIKNFAWERKEERLGKVLITFHQRRTSKSVY